MAEVFENNHTFWNGSLDHGLKWNATGDNKTKPFNASKWSRDQTGAVAHVIHYD